MDQLKQYASELSECLTEKKSMHVGLPVASLFVGGVLPFWGAAVATAVALAYILITKE